MKRKNVRQKKTEIPTLSQAINIALNRKIDHMAGRVKVATVKTFGYRVKSFIRNQYDPKLGVRQSVETYLARLKQGGYSTSYIRGMKSVLYGFVACLPTYHYEV